MSCILTLPPYQRKGYGRLLIDFSEYTTHLFLLYLHHRLQSRLCLLHSDYLLVQRPKWVVARLFLFVSKCVHRQPLCWGRSFTFRDVWRLSISFLNVMLGGSPGCVVIVCNKDTMHYGSPFACAVVVVFVIKLILIASRHDFYRDRVSFWVIRTRLGTRGQETDGCQWVDGHTELNQYLTWYLGICKEFP